jgi:hypothetical protein
MLQWIWPVPLFCAALAGPESKRSLFVDDRADNAGPWWLVRKGRIEDAKKQLTRLAATDHYSDEKLEETVALMVHTNEMEKAEVAGTGFTDCFKGTNRRRTEIVRCNDLKHADMVSFALSGVFSTGVEMSLVVTLLRSYSKQEWVRRLLSTSTWL